MNIAELDAQLNAQVLGGDILGAFEKFYAEGVVMQENNAEPTVGKDANRENERKFVGSVQEFHGAAVVASAVNGDVSFSQWTMDVTFQGGFRTVMNQVAVRRWADGLVVHERFFYNKG